MRKEFNFHYSICTETDEELFYKQCAAIEKHVPGLTKERLMSDVDGSLYQTYYHEQGEIDVCNDHYIGALYVDSDFDLEPYFE